MVSNTTLLTRLWQTLDVQCFSSDCDDSLVLAYLLDKHLLGPVLLGRLLPKCSLFLHSHSAIA